MVNNFLHFFAQTLNNDMIMNVTSFWAFINAV